MQFIKKSALGLSASLLVIMLFVFGLAFGLYRMFDTPDTIKSALKDSGIYQSVVGDALQQAQKEQPSEGQDKIPIDNPDVQNLIKGAVPPELLQAQTEQALDSIYGWVQGKTPKIEFAVQLGDIKNSLADGLAKYAEEKAASLPTCAPGAAPGEGFDPWKATCVPKGMSPSLAAAEAKNQILNGEFLKETTLTADSLKGEDGKAIEESLAAVPVVYRLVGWAVYGTGLLALLLALAVVFLSVNRRSGLKKVSWTFIVVGAISALLSWLASFGVNWAAKFAEGPLQQSGGKVARILAADLRSWWMWYGIALVVAGIVTLVVLRLTKPKSGIAEEKPAGPTGEAMPAAAAKAEDKPKPAARPKPRPVKKLVQ